MGAVLVGVSWVKAWLPSAFSWVPLPSPVWQALNLRSGSTRIRSPATQALTRAELRHSDSTIAAEPRETSCGVEFAPRAPRHAFEPDACRVLLPSFQRAHTVS